MLGMARSPEALQTIVFITFPSTCLHLKLIFTMFGELGDWGLLVTNIVRNLAGRAGGGRAGLGTLKRRSSRRRRRRRRRRSVEQLFVLRTYAAATLGRIRVLV